MRETLLPLLRDNYPRIAKDLLGGLLDVLTQARAESGGDLDKFQVFLVVAMRTVEDRRFAELQFDEVLSGGVATYPSLHTNIRSIAESTGIPKETVRRKVTALIGEGWVTRTGNDLSITPYASQHFTPARDALLRLVCVGYQALDGLKADSRQQT